MIQLNVKVALMLKEYLVSTAKFRELVRESLIEGGCKLWVERYFPLHFNPVSYSRYYYARRSKRWDDRKRYVKEFTINGAKRPNPNYGKAVPDPFVWTGDLKEALLGNARSGAMLAAARQSRYTVAKNIGKASQKVVARVPLTGMPHPINTKYARKGDLPGELTRLSTHEISAMSKETYAVLKQKMSTFPLRVVKESELSESA